MMKPLFAAAAFAALLPWQAMAATYQTVDAPQSQLQFHYAQMGVALDGDFKHLNGQIQFDPAHPETSHARIEVKLDSVDTGTDEGNSEVLTPTWLNISAHPVATFETTSIKALGENRYEAHGTLSIKGNQRDITIPATFTEKDGTGVFTGKFDITRADFGIGEGPWAATDIVAGTVGVSFSLAVRP